MKWMMALRTWIFETTMSDYDKSLAHFKSALIDFRVQLSEIHYEIVQTQAAVDVILSRMDEPPPVDAPITRAPVPPSRESRRFDSEHRQIGV